MIEKQSVNGKDVWIKVDPHPANRENPNVIPTEYFTATVFLQEPADGDANGELMVEEGKAKLFESPVAALSFASKRIEGK